MPRARIIVHGRVQGVGFRYHAARRAEALGVSGYARNEYDGTVEIEAQADEKTLARFVEEIREGPSFSLVTSLDVTPMPESQESNGFRVRH